MSQPRNFKRIAARTVATIAGLCGVTTLLRRRRRSAGDFRVFILEYHGVDAQDRESEGTISQSRFRHHVTWLKRRFKITSVATAARALSADRLEEDLVVLTFDDGYLNNVEGAWPVLRELDVTATIYLTTAFLDGEELWFDVARRALQAAEKAAGGSPASEVTTRLAQALDGWPSRLGLEPAMRRLKNLPAAQRLSVVDDLRRCRLELSESARAMSWHQARQLRDGGIELGAHTLNHPILSRLDDDTQEAEIGSSQRRIQEELGAKPSTFAMPNGAAADYNPATLEILGRLGFQAACTTRRGSNAPGCNLLELRRLGVGSDSIHMLSARLAGLFDEGIRRLLPFA